MLSSECVRRSLKIKSGLLSISPNPSQSNVVPGRETAVDQSSFDAAWFQDCQAMMTCCDEDVLPSTEELFVSECDYVDWSTTDDDLGDGVRMNDPPEDNLGSDWSDPVSTDATQHTQNVDEQTTAIIRQIVAKHIGLSKRTRLRLHRAILTCLQSPSSTQESFSQPDKTSHHHQHQFEFNQPILQPVILSCFFCLSVVLILVSILVIVLTTPSQRI